MTLADMQPISLDAYSDAYGAFQPFWKGLFTTQSSLNSPPRLLPDCAEVKGWLEHVFNDYPAGLKCLDFAGVTQAHDHPYQPLFIPVHGMALPDKFDDTGGTSLPGLTAFLHGTPTWVLPRIISGLKLVRGRNGKSVRGAKWGVFLTRDVDQALQYCRSLPGDPWVILIGCLTERVLHVHGPTCLAREGWLNITTLICIKKNLTTNPGLCWQGPVPTTYLSALAPIPACAELRVWDQLPENFLEHFDKQSAMPRITQTYPYIRKNMRSRSAPRERTRSPPPRPKLRPSGLSAESEARANSLGLELGARFPGSEYQRRFGPDPAHWTRQPPWREVLLQMSMAEFVEHRDRIHAILPPWDYQSDSEGEQEPPQLEAPILAQQPHPSRGRIATRGGAPLSEEFASALARAQRDSSSEDDSWGAWGASSSGKAAGKGK